MRSKIANIGLVAHRPEKRRMRSIGVASKNKGKFDSVQ